MGDNANIQENLENKLKELYEDLFKKFEIDEKTGVLNNYEKFEEYKKAGKLKKFPTYPYIGSKYGSKGVPKILVIGLDIGSDEKKDGIKSFKERREDIGGEKNGKYNPHIAGTYFLALYFLEESPDLEKSFWEKIGNKETCQGVLKNIYNVVKNEGNIKSILNIENPLHYISLTNYYKFVTKDRDKKFGGNDRIYLNKSFEKDFLLKEIKEFNPDIILFQSKKFENILSKDKDKNLINRIKEIDEKIEIYIGYHPSYSFKDKKNPEKDIRNPKELIKSYEEYPKD